MGCKRRATERNSPHPHSTRSRLVLAVKLAVVIAVVLVVLRVAGLAVVLRVGIAVGPAVALTAGLAVALAAGLATLAVALAEELVAEKPQGCAAKRFTLFALAAEKLPCCPVGSNPHFSIPAPAVPTVACTVPRVPAPKQGEEAPVARRALAVPRHHERRRAPTGKCERWCGASSSTRRRTGSNTSSSTR